MHLIILGRPVSKERPRVTDSHTYTPSSTHKQESRILFQYENKFGRKELEGDIELICGFYYSDARTADVDNLLKLVMDSLGGGGEGWHPFNDRQVVKLHGYLAKKREEEKTIIYLREI